MRISVRYEALADLCMGAGWVLGLGHHRSDGGELWWLQVRNGDQNLYACQEGRLLKLEQLTEMLEQRIRDEGWVVR